MTAPADPRSRVFRAWGRRKPTTPGAPLSPVIQSYRHPVPRPTREQCAACDVCHWGSFGGGVEARCCHPHGVCTSSAARLQPWDRMPFCPAVPLRAPTPTFT